MTCEMRLAYQFRDQRALQKIIGELCEELIQLDAKDPSYDFVASRLQIALALLNSISRRGETIAFISDFINF